MTPLLLLVDLQRDYLNAAELEPAAGQIVERAAVLLHGCRAANIPVVHVWTTVSRDNDQRMPHWRRLSKWLCVEGTHGHQSPAPLQPMAAEPVVHKRFFSAFSSGTLRPILAACQIDTLIIAGIHLHGCVRETVLDAYEQGLEICVAEDAVGSDDPLHAAITRRYLEERAARFAPVNELLPMFGGETGKIPKSGASPSTRGEPTADLITAATVRARQAWPGWSTVEPTKRRESLERVAVLLEHKAASWAEQMAREIGKPVTYGRIEVEKTAELVRAIARQDLSVQEAGRETSARRRAVGVIAVITPWNNPVLIPLGKIAAALFYGNTVVWKPAPAAASIANEVMECLRAADLAEGPVTLLQGDQRGAAELMSDPRVEAVTLTGGLLAGYSAQEICARRHIPLQAELGGNNAAIVWPDADLDDAARRVAEGAFGQGGQRCTANRRAVVHQDCCDRFVDLLTRATAALPFGDPLNGATRIGPLVNAKQRDRVASLIERAAGAGTVIVPHGSKPQSLPNRFYPPTIVRCDDPTHEIVQEETFGPVLVIQKTADWAQAIKLCNGVRQGLAAAVFTDSEELQQRFLSEAQAGILKINQSTADADVTLPFGGWKASGVGPAEHGIADQEFYTRLQTIYHAR